MTIDTVATVNTTYDGSRMSVPDVWSTNDQGRPRQTGTFRDRNKARDARDVQGVHKVSLQFKKIIKKWNDEISQWGLFYVNQYFIKFLLPH